MKELENMEFENLELENLEFGELQLLCQKHGLFGFLRPEWSELRKKDAMLSRLKDVFGTNQNELIDTDDSINNEDENGEKYLQCM